VHKITRRFGGWLYVGSQRLVMSSDDGQSGHKFTVQVFWVINLDHNKKGCKIFLYCCLVAFPHNPHNKNLSYHGTNLFMPCWYQSLSSVIRHYCISWSSSVVNRLPHQRCVRKVPSFCTKAYAIHVYYFSDRHDKSFDVVTGCSLPVAFPHYLLSG